MNKHTIQTITGDDQNFPTNLREIPTPPHVIYYIGDITVLQNPCLAIVGTRKATDTGETLAHEFAEYFAAHGIVVISGLALGIDKAAHEGALEAQGKTIAVLARGLDNIYPKQNERLAEDIIKTGGLLIAEYPAGTPALPHQFLERNRIISGLSKGIVVIEAPERSGALSTATHAIEQNRDVFVVPGPAKHPNYKGSHWLIKTGACLVSTPEEVLHELNMTSENQSLNLPSHLTPHNVNEEERKIIDALQRAGKPLEVDKICASVNIEVSATQRILGTLTLKGIIQEDGGTYYL